MRCTTFYNSLKQPSNSEKLTTKSTWAILPNIHVGTMDSSALFLNPLFPEHFSSSIPESFDC